MNTDAESAIIAELEAITSGANDRDGFYTVDELSDLMGLEGQAVRKRLKKAERAGKLDRLEFRGTALNGRPCVQIGYRIKPS